NIDSLARNGVRFTNGYVSAPVCCPSRAGLMTGRYQTRFGHELNAIGAQNLEPHVGLPLTETTLASALKQAGYATGMVGKWHLGGSERFHPLQRGFDSFYGFLHEGHFFLPPPYPGATSFLRTNALPPDTGPRLTAGHIIWSSHLRHNEPPYDVNNPILRGTQPITETDYLTDAFTREATAFIAKHESNRPFFLYLPYNAVHSPLQATPKYLDRFPHIADIHRRIFAAMLSALDDSIGAVLKQVRDAGHEQNTLIFFLSDNGGPTAELTSSNKPLSGGKGALLEGGIRVPFLAQWKGRLPAGKVYEQPVISLDIFATALAAAGAKLPAKLDGVDLLPYLTGAKSGAPHDALFWRYGPQLAVRRGDWKLVKLPPRLASKPVQLFNLATDVAEQHDLSEKEPAKVRELEKLLSDWNAQQVPPLWGDAKPKAKK
ncbi:MAG: sulfatase-like hydrolase/transferase, partial [Verrucomicrobiota bacterium]